MAQAQQELGLMAEVERLDVSGDGELSFLELSAALANQSGVTDGGSASNAFEAMRMPGKRTVSLARFRDKHETWKAAGSAEVEPPEVQMAAMVAAAKAAAAEAAAADGGGSRGSGSAGSQPRWSDPDFAADKNALRGGGGSRQSHAAHRMSVDGLVWKRLSELSTDGARPSLFGADSGTATAGAPTPGDVIQGSHADCWLACAMSLATLVSPSCVRNLFLDVAGASEIGLYGVRLWRHGSWRTILVDDFVPVDPKGGVAFSRNRDPSAIWVPVLQKAYAKIYGSYDALCGGNIAEALTDITAGAVESLNMDGRGRTPEQVWGFMAEALDAGAVLGCTWSCLEKDNKLPKRWGGLMMNHAYAIIDAFELIESDEAEATDGDSDTAAPEKLLMLRNPWGEQVPVEGHSAAIPGLWEGDWADGMRQDQKKIPETAGDGVFFMALADFCRHFNRVYRCYPADEEEQVTHQCWGAWRYADCAGGCSDFSTFSRNPQYRVTVRGVSGQAPPPASKKKRQKTRVSTAAGEARQALVDRANELEMRDADKLKAHGPLTKWQDAHTPRVGQDKLSMRKRETMLNANAAAAAEGKWAGETGRTVNFDVPAEPDPELEPEPVVAPALTPRGGGDQQADDEDTGEEEQEEDLYPCLITLLQDDQRGGAGGEISYPQLGMVLMAGVEQVESADDAASVHVAISEASEAAPSISELPKKKTESARALKVTPITPLSGQHLTVRRSSYWNMREVSYCVDLPLSATQAEPQEYLLVPTTYHPNVPAVFSIIIRSHPSLGLQLDPEPFRDEYTSVSADGMWRGAANGAVGGGSPSQKSFMNNPQYVLSTDAPAASSAVGSGGGRLPGLIGPRGSSEPSDDDAVTYVTLRLVEGLRKVARGAPALPERVDRIPKLGMVVIRVGGNEKKPSTDEGADPRARLDKKPSKSWIITQTSRTSLEVCCALPRGWDRAPGGGDGSLLIIPCITPRSSGGSAVGKSMKFELRVMSSEQLRGGLALAEAAVVAGGGGGAGGPFAGKPTLAKKPTLGSKKR